MKLTINGTTFRGFKSEYREFSNFYNEMVYWLEEARKVLLYHPLNSYPERNIVASFCGLFVIVMISKIEYILKKWQDIEEIKEILLPYFQENTSNGEKVTALYESMRKFLGNDVDKEIFDAYLAIKYIRNTIVHGKWRNKEKEWIKEQGFPNDVRDLQEKHLQRIKEVFQKMVKYLEKVACSSYEVLFNSKYDELVEIAELPLEENNFSQYLIVGKADIPRIFYRNLLKINNYIDRCFEKIISLKKYSWKEGFNEKEIHIMDEETVKKLKYQAIKRAVKDNIPEVIEMRKFAKEALESWKEYWKLTFKEKNISTNILQKAIIILSKLHFSDNYKKLPFFPWSPKEQENKRIGLIETIMTPNSGYNAKEIDNALLIGEITYNLIFPPWEPLLELFLIKLPIIDLSHRESYYKEGEKALLIIKLADYYCNFLEGSSPSEWIKFYERILSNNLDNFIKEEK